MTRQTAMALLAASLVVALQGRRVDLQQEAPHPAETAEHELLIKAAGTKGDALVFQRAAIIPSVAATPPASPEQPEEDWPSEAEATETEASDAGAEDWAGEAESGRDLFPGMFDAESKDAGDSDTYGSHSVMSGLFPGGFAPDEDGDGDTMASQSEMSGAMGQSYAAFPSTHSRMPRRNSMASQTLDAASQGPGFVKSGTDFSFGQGATGYDSYDEFGDDYTDYESFDDSEAGYASHGMSMMSTPPRPSTVPVQMLFANLRSGSVKVEVLRELAERYVTGRDREWFQANIRSVLWNMGFVLVAMPQEMQLACAQAFTRMAEADASVVPLTEKAFIAQTIMALMEDGKTADLVHRACEQALIKLRSAGVDSALDPVDLERLQQTLNLVPEVHPAIEVAPRQAILITHGGTSSSRLGPLAALAACAVALAAAVPAL